MTKLNKIKSIEDFRKYNIICTNNKEVEEGLRLLEEAGEPTQPKDIEVEDYEFIIKFFCISRRYIPSNVLNDTRKNINFYQFKKIYKKLMKQEKQEQKENKDFEIDSTGRITKINNWENDSYIYIFTDGHYKLSWFKNNLDEVDKKFFNELIENGLLFISEEARDKALFKMKIEQKLRTIAERLNNGEKIDWNNLYQYKYNIYYQFQYKKIYLNNNYDCSRQDQGTIYCLSKDFLKVAKEEIGEQELIKYFTEE